MNPHLLRAAEGVTDEDTLAVDFSDISKEFGGEGMEGMERGWDGSRHCTAMGHDFLGYCRDPESKDALVENIGVIVVESRFDHHSVYLYVVCPDEMLLDPNAVFRYAVRAAQAYCDRWQIETSFLTVKQEFALEKVRVRKFRRLENIFALCLLAYDFMTEHIRKSKRYKGIVKALKDNVADVALKTHSLLIGIRALAQKTRIRFISGRPRMRGKLLPGQLTLPLTASDGSAYCL